MRAALFDSNIVIDFAVGLPQALDESRRYKSLSLSIVSWIEVMAGVDAFEDDTLRQTLLGFDVVQLTTEVAERKATIRRERRLKLPDAIVQATAEEHGLLLVTRDTRAFPASMVGVRNPYKI